MGIQTINHGGRPLAIILRADYHAEGIQFLRPTTSPSSSAT